MRKVPIRIALACQRKELFRKQRFNELPTGVFQCRSGFPCACDPVTHADIAIRRTGITEFAEEAIGLGRSKGQFLHGIPH